MADQITIDIQLLQGVFGQLQQVQQAVAGITGGVAAMDRATAGATNNISQQFRAVDQALGQTATAADQAMGGMVQDLLGPIARTQELEQKLRDLNQRMSTTRSVREMSALKREAVAVQAELNRIDARGIESRVSGPVSGLRSMLGGLAGPIAGAFAVGGITAFASGVVQAAAGAQSYSTALEVMLQNKGAADAMVQEVKQFAANTPFDLPQVQAASQQLLAFGFESTKVVPQLQVLGNVASALNQPVGDIAYLFGTAKVQGRLYTNDLMQFMNRGIPIVSELSKVMGVSEAQVKKLTEEGKVGFSELEQAMNNLGGAGGRFDGLMERQSKTIGGLLGALSDNWNTFKADLGLSLAPVIAGSIGMLQDAMGGLRQAMTWVEEHGTLVKGVLIGVAVAVGIYTAALMTNAVASFVATARSAGLAAALGVQAVVTNLVSAATTVAEVAQWALNAAMMANPIGIVIVAIGALVAAIAWAWENVEWFRGALTAYFEAYKSVFLNLWDIAKNVFDAIVQVVMSSWKVIKGVMTFDGDMIAQGWAEHQAGASKLIDTLTGAPKKIVGGVVDAAVRGYEQGTSSYREEAAAEAGSEAADAKRKELAAARAAAGATASPTDVGGSSLLGAAPAPAATGGKGGGVTVGGSGGGGDRNITMSVSINLKQVVGSSKEGASKVADEVIGALVNKLRDAEYALG